MQKRLKELLASKPKVKKQATNLAAEAEAAYGEQAVLEKYLQLTERQTELNKNIKRNRSQLGQKNLGTLQNTY